MSAKPCTAAASNNRDHASQSLLLLLARATHTYFCSSLTSRSWWITINATPRERLQQYHLLSLDQSKQSDSPNGKITPAVLFLLMPNTHFLVKFWKSQKAVSILPHDAKTLLELFCLQQIVHGWRQNSSSSSFTSWDKRKINNFTLADQH